MISSRVNYSPAFFWIPLQQSYNFGRPKKLIISSIPVFGVELYVPAMYVTLLST
jgi:hypothetical protein